MIFFNGNYNFRIGIPRSSYLPVKNVAVLAYVFNWKCASGTLFLLDFCLFTRLQLFKDWEFMCFIQNRAYF